MTDKKHTCKTVPEGAALFFEKPNKVKTLFFKDEDVVAEQKRILDLQEKRFHLLGEIKKIAAVYNDSSLNSNDVGDLSDFLEKDENDHSLTSMELRAKLRKDHGIKIEEIDNLTKEIYAANIELLLAKINCIQSELDEKEEDGKV